MSYQVAIVKTPAGKSYAKLTFVGDVDINELKAAFAEVSQLPEFTHDMDSCWDYSAAKLEMGYLEIKELAEHFVRNSKNRKGQPYCALISHDPGDISLLKTYVPIAARYPVVFKIHQNLHSALEWLDSH